MITLFFITINFFYKSKYQQYFYYSLKKRRGCGFDGRFFRKTTQMKILIENPFMSLFVMDGNSTYFLFFFTLFVGLKDSYCNTTFFFHILEL